MSRRDTGFSPQARELIQARSGGLCEIRWCCDGDRATQHHHRRPRGLGGSRRASTNLASNGLAACTACHAFVESHRALALECGWLIPQAEDCPETVPAQVLVGGRRHGSSHPGRGRVVITVSCAECAKKLGRPVRSEYPDRDGAAAFVRRHHAPVGRRADIQEEQ